MANSSLEIETVLSPLLEGQISPPYRITLRHLDYLQKWRTYLLWIWTNESCDNEERKNAQQSVDELISTILLIDFVRQTYPTGAPNLLEILRFANKPTALDLCEAVYNHTSCKILKAVFDPNRLSYPMIEPKRNIELSTIANISETTDALYSSRMPITLLGDFYQLCLDHPIAERRIYKNDSIRRIKGTYYTPAPLVDYLVFHTLTMVFHKLAPKQIEYLRILDPSCGCGAFLIAATRFILKWLENKYDNTKQSSYISPQGSLKLLESMICGTDVDRKAIHWTRRLLLLTVWDFHINKGVSKKDIQNLKVPTLEESITCMDFLEARSLINKTFNAIIGGPPFVRVQELYKSNPAKVDNYKRNFITACNGQFDLYMLFIEKAIELLTNHGYLGMSISNTFLRSKSGCTLRRLITKKCTISEIVEFEDSKLYPNALVQIAAIMLKKTAAKKTTKYVFVKGKGSLRRKLNGIGKQDKSDFLQIRNLTTIACASDNWILSSESETKLLDKIESAGIPLDKLAVRIYFGADKVFLLKNAEDLNSKSVMAESRFLNDVFVFEFSILRPILRGRHINGYTTPEPKTLCIFPYDKTGKLITEDKLQAESPLTYRYLKSCQNYLYSKKLKEGQLWYSFRNENVSQFIQSPKIVGSVISSGCGFTFDYHQHILCNNSVILISSDERVFNYYYLLAVLNSMVFQAWTQYWMPTIGSGWHSYRINMFRKFSVPIPHKGQDNSLFNEIANLASMLLQNKLNKTDRDKILSMIDDKVCELYYIPKCELLKYCQ